MNEELRKYVERTRWDIESGADATIVCFGDSITAGYAVRRGFPSFLLESLRQRFPDSKIEMINSGISGDTSQDGLSRLDDCVLGLSLEEFEMNLVVMVRRIRAGPDSEILLLSSQPLESPPYDQRVLDYYQTVERVAKEMNVGFVDVYGAWMKRVQAGMPLDSLILPGLDHPNEAGYRIIAEELMSLF